MSSVPSNDDDATVEIGTPANPETPSTPPNPEVNPMLGPTDPAANTPRVGRRLLPLLKKFNIGRHNTTKSATQGAMNVALVTANASQLKSVVDNGPSKQQYYYFFMLILLLSIFLQVTVTFMLSYVGSREAKLGETQSKSSRKTKRVARYVTAILFIVSIINVIMNAFAANVTTST